MSRKSRLCGAAVSNPRRQRGWHPDDAFTDADMKRFGLDKSAKERARSLHEELMDAKRVLEIAQKAYDDALLKWEMRPDGDYVKRMVAALGLPEEETRD